MKNFIIGAVCVIAILGITIAIGQVSDLRYSAAQEEILADAKGLRVIDGDTVSLSIRLLGIDAPEIGGRCAKEKALAARAKAYVKQALKRGRAVLIAAKGSDRYGRTLANIIIDGKDLGDNLIKAGLARVRMGRRGSWC